MWSASAGAFQGVDGLITTSFHTVCNKANEWFMLDLESEYKIASVKIYNVDWDYLDRLRGAEIRVGNVNSFAGNQACALSLPGDAVVTFTWSATGRYVFVVQPSSDTCLHFAEIEVSTVSSTCTSCVAGKYAAASASTVCTNFPTGKISAAGATACSNCHDARISDMRASVCVHMSTNDTFVGCGRLSVSPDVKRIERRSTYVGGRRRNRESKS